MDSQFKAEIIRRQLSDIEASAEFAEAQVREHLTALDRLELMYGFDVEAYSEVYGLSALDGRNEIAQKLLANWQALYEGLSDESLTVGAYSVSRTLAPGCYGFGKEAEYIYTETGFIAEGPAAISFVKKEEVDTVNNKPYTLNIELSGTILAAGFGDSNGAVRGIILASSSDYSDLLYEKKPRFDEDSKVVKAISGNDFWRASMRAERELSSGVRYMQYHQSDLSRKYRTFFDQQ